MAVHNTELSQFLRSRRDRLTPAQAGIDPFPGPRRVPGLRREELAVAAGLSADYYSRLEQGRQPHISAGVLDALARTLRLDEVETAHLRDLAAPNHRAVPAYEVAQRPDPGLLRLMNTLEHVPVLLLGRRGQVLAHNALLSAVLGSPMEPGSSFLAYLFFDPVARQRIVNWSDFARASVGAMRREAARHPHDRELRKFIDDLRAADLDVSRWWNEQGVRDYTSVPKRIVHPTAGPLSFDIEIVSGPHDPDQRLVVYTVEPESATAQMLPIIASWYRDSCASKLPHR
ncbi:MAG TPA: helix-turn-helix transcriptional regulator [Acidimicrobiales bacterium]|nr:helix-turn-helix transcriptional regulator [Acidimicrobiales bacterium]